MAKKCCKNCAFLKSNYAHPVGQKLNDEYRCKIFNFLYWYTDNLTGMDEISCIHYKFNSQKPGEGGSIYETAHNHRPD